MATHKQIAEKWAGRQHEKGSAGNLYFHKERIYSYGTMIGNLVETPKGIVALCNTTRYSSSTSAQQGLVRFAASQRYPTFLVKHCDGPGMHPLNQEVYAAHIAELRDKEITKPSPREDAWTNIPRWSEQIEKEKLLYEKTFNLDCCPIPLTKRQLAEVAAQAEEAERRKFYAEDPMHAMF